MDDYGTLRRRQRLYFGKSSLVLVSKAEADNSQMRPTPRGLQERFIVPILREVAEAVHWVHQAGIIHRDLKCMSFTILLSRLHLTCSRRECSYYRNGRRPALRLRCCWRDGNIT